MRVFVTGATGFIGTAVVQELLQAGHQVTGLARSDTAARLLEAAGAEVHRGDINDRDSLQRGVVAADGVIHLAFIHDFANFAASCEADRGAISALGAALEGSQRPLLITSGTSLVHNGDIATENDVPAASPRTIPRAASEELALSLAARGVRASIVRLPPTVHGEGDHGFVPALINIAREKGVAAFIGDGSNRWPAVHRFDAARVFRLALEKGAAGARYHAVAEEGIPTRDIAAMIGKGLQLPVESRPPEAAPDHFGWMARFFSLDVPASGKQTQEQLGWRPAHPTLMADLDRPVYFK
ncbi:nucleoside-diphosphate-sugar epimerase [Chitinophaga polysaccharea]|uniref:Nucleoside-diphosphate-sugar epimerase n=1 Tax=Chitinophaga polysaccharea TaxID=1293035 RepID=A0A561PXP4_9BACT|nr:SDR family oxidoreductase [Chitinophaga polysaccharea]TWF42883.1 nucleoside-diphosphate-sugar epimerase [Chitinophaga polysaccharea]